RPTLPRVALWTGLSARHKPTLGSSKFQVPSSGKFQVPGSRFQVEDSRALLFNLEPGTWNLELPTPGQPSHAELQPGRRRATLATVLGNEQDVPHPGPRFP